MTQIYNLLLLRLATWPPGDLEKSHRGARPQAHGALRHRRAPGEGGGKNNGKIVETNGTMVI